MAHWLHWKIRTKNAVSFLELARRAMKLFGLKFRPGGAVVSVDIAEIIRAAKPPKEAEDTEEAHEKQRQADFEAFCDRFGQKADCDAAEARAIKYLKEIFEKEYQ